MRARLIPALAVVLLAAAACSSGVDEAGGPGASGSPTASPSKGSVATDAATTEGTTTVDLPQDAVITYAFYDSSVPPQYHRSFTLTIGMDESRIVVDSYGDVLADEVVPTDPAVWAALGQTLGQVTGLTPEQAEQGCTGGTGMSLDIDEGEQSLVSLDVEECGGTNAAIAEAVRAWIAPARDQFPAMDVLAPEGE